MHIVNNIKVYSSLNFPSIFILLLILIPLCDPIEGQKAALNNNNKKILPKVRHSRGKYTVKEEVVKRVEHNHPCKLTRTAVKVTFPSMKSEVLVSFIGYKEPRLMFVNRCKGLCSSEAIGSQACIATKKSRRKVNMQLKTQVLGRTETKEKFRELVLEEHEECACQCLTMSPSHCIRPELFNNETCSCSCDKTIYRDKVQCESYSGMVWDELTCSCRRSDELPAISEGIPSVSLTSNGDETFQNIHTSQSGNVRLYDPAISPKSCHECYGCFSGHVWVGTGDIITRHSWTVFGLCLTVIVLLLSSSIYFWKKSKRLKKELIAAEEVEEEEFEEEERRNLNGKLQDDRFSPAGIHGKQGQVRIKLNGGMAIKSNTLERTENIQMEHLKGLRGASSGHIARDLAERSQTISPVVVQRHSTNNTGTMSKVKTRKARRRKKSEQLKLENMAANIRLDELMDLKPTTTFTFGDELDPNFVNHSLVQH